MARHEPEDDNNTVVPSCSLLVRSPNTALPTDVTPRSVRTDTLDLPYCCTGTVDDKYPPCFGTPSRPSCLSRATRCSRHHPTRAVRPPSPPPFAHQSQVLSSCLLIEQGKHVSRHISIESFPLLYALAFFSPPGLPVASLPPQKERPSESGRA